MIERQPAPNLDGAPAPAPAPALDGAEPAATEPPIAFADVAAPAPAAALRGDLTQGPILRTLVAFALPALVANFFQTVGGSINMIWVGQLLGERAVAATATANLVMMLMLSCVFGFGMGTTIQVGRHYGARDLAGARRSFAGGIGFCVGLGLVIAVLGLVFAPGILRVMATPAEARAPALAYLRVSMLSIPFTCAAMMIGMGLRGSGDGTTQMTGSIVAVLLDIGLNPLLIRGIGPIPPLGIAGSALSSGCASLLGVVVMIAMVYLRRLPLRLSRADLRCLVPGRADLAYMLGKGLPMGASTTSTSAAGLVVIGLVNRQGLLAAAAYGASLQLWNYLQMPAVAVGSAISTMVSQNIGAARHDRVTAITAAGILVALGVTGTLAAIILVFDVPILGLFLGHGSAAIPLAQHIQRICTWSFLFVGMMMAIFATMRAYGAVLVPLAIMTVAFYPVRLGFYYLAYPHIGGEAVWWAYPAGSTFSVAATLVAYRFGRWRRLRTGAAAR